MIRLFLLALLLFGPPGFMFAAQMDDMATTPTAENILIYNVWALPGDESDTGTIYLEVANSGEQPVALLGLDAAAVAQYADTDERGRGPVIEPGETTAVVVELSGMDEPLITDTALPFTIGFIAIDEDGNATGNPLSLASAAHVVEAEPDFPAEIIVANARVRATVSAEMAADMDEMDMGDDMAAGIPPSAAYMTLFYRTDETGDEAEPFADALIAAETSAAGVVEIHTTEIDGDVMRMRQIDGIELAPDAPAVLQPGGDHVMLMQLPADLLPGDAITLTLIFESGLEITIAAPVVEIQRSPMMDMDMHDHMDTESDG